MPKGKLYNKEIKHHVHINIIHIIRINYINSESVHTIHN